MTTAESPDPAARAARGSSLALRFAIAFLAGIVLVIGLGAGALYAYGQQYTGRVLPGVTVGTVDLSGLTPEQARSALEEGFAELGAGLVTLTGPEGEAVIGYGTIGRRPDVDAMLAAALTAGRQGEAVADLVGAPQAAIRGVALAPVVTYDQAKLAAEIAAVAATIDRRPVDATLVKAENGEFVLTESVEGRVVDRAALLRTIDEQVARLDAPGELRAEIPMTFATAALDTADAEAARDAAERMAKDIVLTRGEETRRSHLIVALIIASIDFGSDDEFELAVSVTGSLGARAIRDTREVSVVVSAITPEFAKRAVVALRSLATLTPARLLDDLAMVEHGPAALGILDVARLAGDDARGVSVAFLVVGSTVTPARLRTAAAGFPPAVEVVVILCDPDHVPGRRRLGTFTVVTIGSLADLRRAMRGAQSW